VALRPHFSMSLPFRSSVLSKCQVQCLSIKKTLSNLRNFIESCCKKYADYVMDFKGMADHFRSAIVLVAIM
jgi:hypothetical protein